MNEPTRLDPSLSLRNARWDDLQSITKLIYDVCEADGDTTVAVTSDELENWWKTPGFDLSADAFVVAAPDGTIVGYEELADEESHAELNADGYVHPNFKEMGVGTSLLRAAEKRAREYHLELAPPHMRAFIHASTDNKDEIGKAMFSNEGYSVIRYHWRMEIQLTETPPAPVIPAGIEFRPYRPDVDAQALWQADNEAFRDHWGSHDSTFEEWAHRKLGRTNFDPSLWIIAWDGDQIAGFSQNRFRMGIGWIGTLGVRRPWRKRGLGLALLHHSFREFHSRGMNTIGLGVDASNPTGATRLYQRAGMNAVSEFVTFEKELRPAAI